MFISKPLIIKILFYVFFKQLSMNVYLQYIAIARNEDYKRNGMHSISIKISFFIVFLFVILLLILS